LVGFHGWGGMVVVRKSLRLRKGTLYPGLLIRARAKSKILGGGFLGRSNRVVLLRKRDSRASKRADIVPVGKRVWYSLPLSFRKRGGFSKLVAIAPGFIG
jgi:hypothetical protein